MRHCCTPSTGVARARASHTEKGIWRAVEKAGQRAVFHAEAEKGNAPLVQVLGRA